MSHKHALMNKIHYNTYLQKAWNKYGQDNFKFEIIEKVDDNFLTEKELYWFEKTECYNYQRGFNVAKPGDIRHRTNPGITGRSHSEKSKLKMSIVRTGRAGYKHTQEDKMRLSLALKGKKRSKIAIENWKRANDGINIGSKNSKAILTEEDIPKIRKLHKDNVPVKEIANIYNVGICAIYDIINKRNWRHVV